jgi:hypothetical protein
LNEKVERTNMISEESILTEEELEKNRMEMNVELDYEEDYVGEEEYLMKDDEEYEEDVTFVDTKIQQKADKIVRQRRKSKVVQEVVEVIQEEENHYVETGEYENEMELTANQRVYSQSYQGISIDLASIQAEKLLGIDGGLHVPYIPVVYAPYIDLMVAVKKKSWDMFLPLAITTKEIDKKVILIEEKNISHEIIVNKRKRISFDDEVLVGIGVDIEEQHNADDDDESHMEEEDDEDIQSKKRSRNNDSNQFDNVVDIPNVLSIINNVDESKVEDIGRKWCDIDKDAELTNKENENIYNIKIRNKKTKKNYRNNLFNHFEQDD